PRRPSSTIRIFSSAPYCLRVARRMSLMTCSAGAFPVPDFCLIFAPLKGYDEPEILRSQLSRFGPISADAGQAEGRAGMADRSSRPKVMPDMTGRGSQFQPDECRNYFKAAGYAS